jgi:hypothetical protein
VGDVDPVPVLIGDANYRRPVVDAGRRWPIVRAYALIEVDRAATDAVNQVRTFSLGNCKVIAERLYPSEVVAHFEATELSDFNTALTDLVAGVPAIIRITVLRITEER